MKNTIFFHAGAPIVDCVCGFGGMMSDTCGVGSVGGCLGGRGGWWWLVGVVSTGRLWE